MSASLGDAVVIEVRCNEYTGRVPNPNVPWSADEIAADALSCRSEGASIVHFHARDPQSGAPAWATADYAAVIGSVRSHTDVLLNPTLGASTIADPLVRCAHIPELAASADTRPELAPVDLATLNIDPYDAAARRFVAEDLTYVTSIRGLRHEIAAISEAGVAVQAVLWNVGSCRLLGAFVDMGVLPSNVFAEIILSDSLLSAHPGTIRGLETMVEFLPAGVHWSVARHGGNLLELAPRALELGGHLSIGIGDFHYDGCTNAALVAEAAVIARSVGREPATPDDVRAALS